MSPLNKVNFIVIHCADTKSTMNTTIEDLHKWHVIENGWSDIGYHWFVKFDGTVHQCRSESSQGAHCKTLNNKSIAICLEGGFDGEDNFTEPQKYALSRLIDEKKAVFKNAAVIGHGHIDDKKCPSFDIVSWYEDCIKSSY